MSLKVLRPGLLSTVQDRGRHGLQHVGLCPGGAMDEVSLALANALVGNAPGEAALEVTVIGPQIEFEEEALVALCGAEFDGNFSHNRPLLVAAGSRMNVGHALRGARAYLAVAGGLHVEPVLGSRSTYLPGEFGGFHGRALRRGDALALREPAAAKRFVKLKNARHGKVTWSAPPLTLPESGPVLIHVIEGQHFGLFAEKAQRAFFDTVWRIAPESTRMGFRLVGPALEREKPEDVLSAPTALGTIQVPADGAPIALMADHQTTGGYPRIAEVASADVPRLAQLAPGASVHFARCDLAFAAGLRHHMGERLATALQAIALRYGG